MVNYSDPHTIAREATAGECLHHAFAGLFIWEILTTLDYEWDVIRGRRPYRWTIWIYTIARMGTLLGVADEMIGFDTTFQLNCQAWGTLGLVFSSIAFAAASLLIVLRIVAIWNREKIIILIAMGVWVTDVVFLINSCVRLRVWRSHEDNMCAALNKEIIKPSIMASLIADVVLLLIMLIGLFRPPFGAGDALSLERVLQKQGLIWFLLAVICEIPPTVFICLDLNEALNWMFQHPNTVIMTITATKMYRSLMDLGSSEISQESLPNSRHAASKMRFRFGPIQLSQMGSARTEIEQSSKTQTAGSSSYVGIDSPAHEVSHNINVKSGPPEK